MVHCSTDNGPHYNTWPDAAATPLEEKDTNWEGGWRFCCFKMASETIQVLLIDCSSYGYVTNFCCCC